MATSARHGPGIEKKKARKKPHTLCLRMVAALDRQRQRLVPLRRVVGTTTRERERERERGERGREREEGGRGGEREKGEREKRGREIEGALFFFHTSPEFCFLFILVTCKSLFFLFFLLSPFFLLLSPPTRQMCLFLPPVEISSIMATIPSSSELLSARFRGMGRETAAVLNSSAPNE